MINLNSLTTPETNNLPENIEKTLRSIKKVFEKLNSLKDLPPNERFIETKIKKIEVNDVKAATFYLGILGKVDACIKSDTVLNEAQKTTLLKRDVTDDSLTEEIINNYSLIFDQLKQLQEITFSSIDDKTATALNDQEATLLNITSALISNQSFQGHEGTKLLLANAGNYAIEFKTQDIESTDSKMDSIINTFQSTGLTFEKTFSEEEEKDNDKWKKEQEHVLTAKDKNNNKILSFHYPRFPISHGENNHYLKIVNHSSYNLLGLKTGEKIHFYASDFDNDPFGNTDEDTTNSFSKKEGKAKEYFFNQNPSYVLDNGNPMKFTDATASVIDQLALAYKYINQLSALKKKIPLNTLNDKNEMIS